MQYNFNQKCTKYAMIPTFFGEKQVYISMYIVQTHEKSLRYIEKGVTGREKVTRKQLSIQKVVGKKQLLQYLAY